MAYRDPYAEQYARSQPQPYNDGPEFNPYGGHHQRHPTYDQAGYEPYGAGGTGYRDEPQVQSPENNAFPSTFHNKESSDFVNGQDEK